MNRIFKVIWSKTKHCYIVVSEYAKANTKAAHTGLRTSAAAAAVAAMLLAPVNYNYAWAAETATVTDTSSTTQQTRTVYTQRVQMIPLPQRKAWAQKQLTVKTAIRPWMTALLPLRTMY